MVVPRRRSRVSRMLLPKRGRARTVPVRPGKILDLSALYDAPRTKAMAIKEHFTARDSHLVHTMERSLQPQATRLSRPRERAPLQGRGGCTPMQQPISNAAKSVQSMAGKRSRASSGGYPSTWNLDEKVAVKTDEQREILSDLNKMNKCCALHCTPYDHCVTTSTPIRRMHLHKNKGRPSGTQTMTNNLLAKQPRTTLLSGDLRKCFHMRGGMNHEYEQKKHSKHQSFHTGDGYTSSDDSSICLCTPSCDSDCERVERYPAKYSLIERISYPPKRHYLCQSDSPDEEMQPVMYSHAVEKVSPKMYDRGMEERSPKRFAREMEEMSPRMVDRERGMMSPQIYSKERGEITPKMHHREKETMKRKIYSPPGEEMYTKMNSREKEERNPKWHSRVRGEASPKVNRTAGEEKKSKMYSRERDEMPTVFSTESDGMPKVYSRDRDETPKMYSKERDGMPTGYSKERDESPTMYSRERGERPTMYIRDGEKLPTIYAREVEKIKHKVNTRERGEIKHKEKDRTDHNKYTGHRRLKLPNQAEILEYTKDDPHVCMRVCQNTQRRGSTPFYLRNDDKLTMKHPTKANARQTSPSCCGPNRICQPGCPMVPPTNREKHSSHSHKLDRQTSGASLQFSKTPESYKTSGRSREESDEFYRARRNGIENNRTCKPDCPMIHSSNRENRSSQSHKLERQTSGASIEFSKTPQSYKKPGRSREESDEFYRAQRNGIENKSSTKSYEVLVNTESLGGNKKRIISSSRLEPAKIRCTRVRISDKEVQTHCICPNCGIKIAPTVDDNVSETEFKSFEPTSILSRKQTPSRINTAENSESNSRRGHEVTVEDFKMQKQGNSPKKESKHQRGERRESKEKKSPTCHSDGSNIAAADHSECSKYNMDQIINLLHETVAGLKKRKNTREAATTPLSRGSTVNNQRMHRAQGQGVPDEYMDDLHPSMQQSRYVPFDQFNPQMNGYVPQQQQPYNAYNPYAVSYNSFQPPNMDSMQMPKVHPSTGHSARTLTETVTDYSMGSQRQHPQQQPQHHSQQQQHQPHPQPEQQPQHQPHQQQQQPVLLHQQHQQLSNNNNGDNAKKVTDYNSYNNNSNGLNSDNGIANSWPINKDLRRKPSGCAYPIGDSPSKGPQLSYNEMKHKTLQKLNPTESFMQYFDMAITLRNKQKEKRKRDDKDSSCLCIKSKESYQLQQKVRKREIRGIESLELLERNRLPSKEKHEFAAVGKRSIRKRLRDVLKNVRPRKKLSMIPNRLLFGRDIEKDRIYTHKLPVDSEVYGSHPRRESNEQAELSKQTRSKKPYRASSDCQLTLSEEETIETERSNYSVKYSNRNKADKPIPPPKPSPFSHLYRKQHDKIGDSSSQKISGTELRSYLENKEKDKFRDMYLPIKSKAQDIDSSGKTKRKKQEPLINPELKSRKEHITKSSLSHSSSSNGIIKEGEHSSHKIKAIEDKSSLYPSCKKPESLKEHRIDSESNSSNHKTRRKKSNSLHSKILESKLSVDTSQEQIRFNKETKVKPEIRTSEGNHKSKQKSLDLFSHLKRSKKENREPPVELEKETSVTSNREQKLMKESSSQKAHKGRCKSGRSHRVNPEVCNDDEVKVLYDSSYKFVKQKEVAKSTKKKCEYKYHPESENHKRLKLHPSESRNNFYKMFR